jgi:hypothetical protein
MTVIIEAILVIVIEEEPLKSGTRVISMKKKINNKNKMPLKTMAVEEGK